MVHATLPLRAGVLGQPIIHSLSPHMHRYWLRHCEVHGEYIPFEVAPAHLRQAVEGLAALGFRGVNVTIPHKVMMYELCDDVDAAARAGRSVNTIVFDRTCGVRGFNSDGFGFLQSVKSAAVDLYAGPILILGGGGAARGIAAACVGEGCEVWVTSRNSEQAAALARDLARVRIVVWPGDLDSSGVKTLVNATAAGMVGQQPLEVSLDRFGQLKAVIDIVYQPLETDLLKGARQRGLRTVDGLEMLMHQATLGFHHWFGLTPKVDRGLRDFLVGCLA